MLDGIIPYAMAQRVSQQVGALTAGITYKGSVNSVTDLPASPSVGDEYTVTSEGNALYLWNGTQWLSFPVNIGDGSELESITTAQIRALFA